VLAAVFSAVAAKHRLSCSAAANVGVLATVVAAAAAKYRLPVLLQQM
jgi:hypothetical protein